MNGWFVDEAAPIVEPTVAGQREVGRFGREVGKRGRGGKLGAYFDPCDDGVGVGHAYANGPTSAKRPER